MTKIPDFMVACPDNVYRTKDYIVAQDLQYKDHNVYDNVLLSHDTYYKRTKKRDAEYELMFEDKDHIDGRRIPSTSYTRKYID